METTKGMKIIPVLGSRERSGHRFDPSRLAPVRVEANREIAPEVRLLSLARPWDFVPGQSVALTMDRAVPPRFYSIASGDRDQAIDVLYDVVPGGELTPRLADLRPGDTVLASPPFGAFQDAKGPACWIATGTGVAPFLSMARSGSTVGKTLVHGSRTLAGLFFRDWLRETLGERYVPCCTRETGPGIFAGRPTAWLAFNTLPAADRFLLCGSSLMVVDARDILIGRGVPFDRVVGEIYF